MPSLQRGASRIIRISPGSGLVIRADHLHRLLRFQIIERQVNGATAVMTRPLGRVGDENLLVVRRGVPENFGDVPGTISIMDEQTVTLRSQLAVDADYGCSGGALHESASFRIEDRPEKVVGGRVADFESDGRVELCQFDQIEFAKLSALFRRRSGA